MMGAGTMTVGTLSTGTAAAQTSPAVSASFILGVLTVVGDAQDNSIVISRDAAGRILVNGGAVVVKAAHHSRQHAGRSRWSAKPATTRSLSTRRTERCRGPPVRRCRQRHPHRGFGRDTLTGQAGNDTLLGKGGSDRCSAARTTTP